jgi:hypothetical protein
MDQEESTLLGLIRDELGKAAGGPAGKVRVEDGELVACDGAMRLRVALVRSEGTHPAIAHAHVITQIGRGPVAVLDACVVGINNERNLALADAARVWVGLAAAPILSLLHARTVLGADHFTGGEKWGVPGYHGFVGPAGVRRFGEDSIDPNAFAEAPLFSGTAELTPGGTVHLVKATLEATDGRWRRTLEIDGHTASHTDENWPFDVPVPASAVICTRFAVYFATGEVRETRRWWQFWKKG